jgi:GT2 family glycosyltransferase
MQQVVQELPSASMAATVPITVGIPTYSREECVFQPIERILACDPVPAEIIVHIDASDGVLEQKLARSFPSVKVITSPDRVGPGGGRHRCLQAASHEVFASFDDDSWPVDADYFSRLMKHVQNSPEAACFATVVAQRNDAMPPVVESAAIVVDYTGCGYALRTSVYRRLTGFVDRPTAYGLEEKDLAMQLHSAGHKIMMCHDLRVFHGTDLAHHSRPEITSATIQNAALLTWLRYPLPLWPYGALQYANVIWFMLRKGRLAGITSGLLGTPASLWKYRHLRQPLPTLSIISYLRSRKPYQPDGTGDSSASAHLSSTRNPDQYLPSVLVGIVTHNRAEILPKAIASAFAQKGCRIRVAVIDDCSTDATPELARQHAAVEWTRWEPGRGYMAARNLWMLSNGVDYFVSLDDDSWFMEEDEIALAVDLMEKQSNVAAVAFDILSPDRAEAVKRQSAQPTNIFIGCGHVLKLKTLRLVGVYDAVPGSYGGEEKDLCLRLIDAGYLIMAMPGVHVWHDKTSVARDFAAQHRSVVCNDLVMTVRRTPAWLLPLFLPGRCWRHFSHAWQHGMMDAFLQGMSMFLQALPAALRTRKAVSARALWAFIKLSHGAQALAPPPSPNPAA